MKKMNYREAIERRKVAIELFRETIEVVKTNSHNELTRLDMMYDRGYPSIDNLQDAINKCENEILIYTENIYEEQFNHIIDERIKLRILNMDEKQEH